MLKREMTVTKYKRSRKSRSIRSKRRSIRSRRRSRSIRQSPRQSPRLSKVYRKKMLLGGGDDLGTENREKTEGTNNISEGLAKAIEELIQSLKKSMANCNPLNLGEKKEGQGQTQGGNRHFGGFYLRNFKKSRDYNKKLSY